MAGFAWEYGDEVIIKRNGDEVARGSVCEVVGNIHRRAGIIELEGGEYADIGTKSAPTKQETSAALVSAFADMAKVLDALPVELRERVLGACNILWGKG